MTLNVNDSQFASLLKLVVMTTRMKRFENTQSFDKPHRKPHQMFFKWASPPKDWSKV